MMIHAMIELIYLLILTNILSLILVAYLWRKARLADARPESLELQEFLVDLMGSGGLIRVSRIAPADVVLRRRVR